MCRTFCLEKDSNKHMHKCKCFSLLLLPSEELARKAGQWDPHIDAGQSVGGNGTSFTLCPDGWMAHMGSCYWFAVHRKSSFAEAEHYCRQQFKSHLVHIDNDNENTFVKNFLRRIDDEHWWLGASDEAVEGVWRWHDTNTTVSVTNWAPGRPDNSHNSEHCAILQSNVDFHWDDVPCSNTYEPICELKSETDVHVSVGK